MMSIPYTMYLQGFLNPPLIQCQEKHDKGKPKETENSCYLTPFLLKLSFLIWIFSWSYKSCSWWTSRKQGSFYLVQNEDIAPFLPASTKMLNLILGLFKKCSEDKEHLKYFLKNDSWFIFSSLPLHFASSQACLAMLNPDIPSPDMSSPLKILSR